MIYWWGINIGDWHFYEEIANIKSAILFQSEHAQWHMVLPINFLPNITPATKSSCTVHIGLLILV